MSRSSTSQLATYGMIAFLAAAGIGWNLFSPAAPPENESRADSPETRRENRPERTARSIAAEAAAKRMGSIRAAADSEARILATLALAESLDPAEFAAWMDGGYFDLRGGPELMMFTKILMDRWEAEDPEGLLDWAEKNKNGEGRRVMEQWAAKDPQRLLEWFRSHRNDQAEIGMLGKIAAHSPDLAIQRLREMADAGMAESAMTGSRELMNVLAGKSAAVLEGILASLPPDLKIQAESALIKKRLEASFSEEIRSLWERPDGWRIFSGMESRELRAKLMGEMKNLPDEWRRLMISNSYQFMEGDNAREWLKTDLAEAGFSLSEIKDVRGDALRHLAWEDPVAAARQLGEVEIDPRVRKEILEQAFRGNSGELKKLAAQLPEEDRKIAEAMMNGREGNRSVGVDAKTTPDELLEKIVALDSSQIGEGSVFPRLDNWDRTKTGALVNGFTTLPDDQKTRAATFITANVEYTGAPMELKGAALLHLAGQPDAAAGSKSEGHESLTAKVSMYAASLATKDPVEAVSWVGSLPAGEAKSWAQSNLHKLWVQYDPGAAEAWKKTLPPADLEAMEKNTAGR